MGDGFDVKVKDKDQLIKYKLLLLMLIINLIINKPYWAFTLILTENFQSLWKDWCKIRPWKFRVEMLYECDMQLLQACMYVV